jgi:predicted nucleic acid-binding protein
MFMSLTGRSAYLDSNIIILSVEQASPWSEVLLRLFQAIDAGSVQAFTPELTIAEVLTKPFAMAAQDVIVEYNKVLSANSTIRVLPITRVILNSAAEFRARTRAKLIDAIHVATANFSACDFFITNDVELGRKIGPKPTWLRPSELAMIS